MYMYKVTKNALYIIAHNSEYREAIHFIFGLNIPLSIPNRT